MYEEPTGDTLAGFARANHIPTAYERFLADEGIPIVGGIGIRDVREADLGAWKRVGGRGAYLQFDGMEGLYGLYALEVPAGGALLPQKHMYEVMFLVIEGRGSTEVWREGADKRATFEWQKGTMFSVPLNLSYQIVNATSSPALLLAVSNAPLAMNLYPDRNFMFNNSFVFSTRYSETNDYYTPRDELETDPAAGNALLLTNLIPDVVRSYLPLDNRRGPGYRHLMFKMAGNTSFYRPFIAEYPSGRYSKAHYHEPGPVLVCLGGKGYTYTWPVKAGPRPWEDGRAELVQRQDYVAGGLVSAAPGGDRWFHQHFAASSEPFRVMNITGGTLSFVLGGEWPVTGTELGERGTVELEPGGTTLGYRDEDPFIRKTYQEELAREGVAFQMPESVFR